MSDDKDYLKKVLSDAFTESLIRFSVIAFLVIVCWWAFAPFLPILLWALVLAIALYPVRQYFESKFGWTSKRSSIVIAILGVFLLGTPSVMVSNSIATKTFEVYEGYNEGTLIVPPPKASVEEWPLIGEDAYKAWSEASRNLPLFVKKRQPQLKDLANGIIESASGMAKSVFLLIGAIIIAGIMLAWAEPGSSSIRRIFVSFSDEKKGPELHELTTATIRQVAVGIIGIAFLTSVIFGIVVALAGVPAAALFTLAALIFAIMQLPVTIIAIVAVALLWSGNDSSTIHNVIFSVFIIAASLVDNFLKPMILGRGLDVPMPVVLIGAIGGMMSGGILGMFIGAAFLAAGYQVFMKWVDTESEQAAETIEQQVSKEKES
ncbi:AI-2E family transporter [Vibrio inusitatus NBRC 102082]|uniref:AI-2E family transporter n=1 Tax=Vibrio inusitatus NBRC 102082 TaxID=1219070 RepID=A0A4Y3HWR3_9VIBR|nr:AI-2E family transporter [Vibrio inusitatus]GEA51619.1 AI-2E family transporter [Vibrio inusitatus NBRC 102082]